MALKNLKLPQEIQQLSIDELLNICEEIREIITNRAIKNGGHFASPLGVVELTVALFHVFNSPKDKIIWDIGHQAHAHKIITDRLNTYHTMGLEGGISSFCYREESPHDVFGAGHSSTAISVAAGMAIARQGQSLDHEIISIIGDGAMEAGMAFEGLNYISTANCGKVIIILNDNGMSMAPSVGGLHNHLRLLRMQTPLEKEQISISATNNFFTNLGLDYIGIIDGHNLENIIYALNYIKSLTTSKPIILHINTKKGKGHEAAEENPRKWHGAPIPTADNTNTTNSSSILHQTLQEIMTQDPMVQAITAAMPDGTGLSNLATTFPDRVFDVGIAEQHAITFSAGLAVANMKPFCAIYSTFLQRGYDQIIHDVAVQKLPVRFMIDRGGFVGRDGPTHHGVFDIGFLQIIPNIVIMAPANAEEMAACIKTAWLIEDRPSAVRYPKSYNLKENEILDIIAITPLEIGKSKIINRGKNIAIICCGSLMDEAEKAKNQLARHSINPTIISVIFIKPFDKKTISKIASNHKCIILIEDGNEGGFGTTIAEFLLQIKYGGDFFALNHGDFFWHHGEISSLKKQAKIDSDAIYNIAIKYK